MDDADAVLGEAVAVALLEKVGRLDGEKVGRLDGIAEADAVAEAVEVADAETARPIARTEESPAPATI